MNKLPTLYKKTSTGAIQFWEIRVLQEHMSGAYLPNSSGMIETTYGQLGTDSPQVTKDFVTEGKNIGKKNATTAYEQACKEARARWEKQKKKGYVESKEAAEAGEVDDLIEGGIVPMLAHKFSDQGHKIVYPAYVQPKLDGIRCIAIVKDGKCTLWTRTRKPITSVPHIVKELEDALPTGSYFFDGELYNHNCRNDFERLVSLVRQEEPGLGHEVIQYHIYDIPGEGAFRDREKKVTLFFNERDTAFKSLIHVRTGLVQNETEATEFFEECRADGYEGAMIRNAGGLYVNKRSYDLLKIKEFDDAEFKIIGIEEGRGRLAGHVGAFVCENTAGQRFLAKARGATEALRRYFEDHSAWKGKKLTVQYQGLTGKNGVPRFPVGVAIRDYE